GLLPDGGQHRVNLATVVGLVVEEVADQKSLRGSHLAPGGAAEPNQVFGHPGIVDLCGPARDVDIRRLARRAQRRKIVDQPGALLDRDVRLWPVVEARHPLAVTPQEMRYA